MGASVPEANHSTTAWPVSSVPLVPHWVVWGVLLLFPALARMSGGVAAAQKLLHVTVAITVVALLLVFRPRAGTAQAFRWALIFCAATSLYYVACTLLLSAEVVPADVSDLVRPEVYLLYFSVPLMFGLEAAQLRRLYEGLQLVVLLSLVYSAFVYVPALWPLVDPFKGRPSDDEVVMHFFRWSGTFGYPSDFAFFLSFFFYFAIVDWLRNRRMNVASALFIVSLVIGIVMTLSRGGILTVFAMTLLVVLTCGWRWAPRTVVGLVLVMSLATVVLVAFWGRVEGLSSDRSNFAYVGAMFGGKKMDRSTVHRIREAEKAIEVATEYFPFGAGPSKERWREELRVVESLYGHLLLKWGVLGLLIYFAGVALLLAACLQVYRQYHADEFMPVFAVATALTIASVPLVFGFSSAMSDRFKVLGFHYLLAGYVCAAWAQSRWLQERQSSPDVLRGRSSTVST